MKLISALSPLVPTNIYDVKTGEEVSFAELSVKIIKLVSFVQQDTIVLYQKNSKLLHRQISETTRLGSANSFARQRGYKSTAASLDSKVKAKSRINELVLHKLVSETASYVNNPNQYKQPPSFSPKINLGAVDSQMVTLSVTGTTLTLVWKCWDEEYLIEFTIPSYILKRNIAKWCLPTVGIRNSKPVFIYSIQETPKSRVKGNQLAGIDLGRVEPFTMAITNTKGQRIAHYTTSSRVKQVNAKRERLIVEKKQIQNKIDNYSNLKLPTEVLSKERNFKRDKITRLGAVVAQQVSNDITKKLVKHDLNMVQVENLKWVVGARYGSRWNHSKQQEAIIHSLARQGIRVVKVNPKNTSQDCHGCGTKIVHDSKNRTVRCVNCQGVFDRDFNAAMNIAGRKSYPAFNRTVGDDCSSNGQVIEVRPHSSILGSGEFVAFLT